MRLHSVLGNSQRLDGGAMFGNCPRAVWEKWCPPDDRHRIDLACRALLVQDDSGRNILLEAGIGAFFEPTLRDRFGVVEPTHVLNDHLAALGVQPSDIDVVVLSHLHFDHAGGLLTPWREGAPPSLVFPRASYVVGAEAWARALAPHARDRASFIPELQGLIEATGRLELVDSLPGAHSTTLGDGWSFRWSSGHTPGLMLTRVDTPRGPITFMGDLVPGTPWVHLPITMGYDRYPELLIDEKSDVLAAIEAEAGWAFYTHDPKVAASRIHREAGRFKPTDPIAILDWA